MVFLRTPGCTVGVTCCLSSTPFLLRTYTCLQSPHHQQYKDSDTALSLWLVSLLSVSGPWFLSLVPSCSALCSSPLSVVKHSSNLKNSVLCLPFKSRLKHGILLFHTEGGKLENLQSSRNVSVDPYPPVSAPWGQFFRPHGLVSTLILSAVKQTSVCTNHGQSSEFTTSKLKTSCRNTSEMIKRNERPLKLKRYSFSSLFFFF